MDAWSWIYIALTALSLGGALLLGRLRILSLTAGGAVALVLSLLSLPFYVSLPALAVVGGLTLLLLHLLPRRRLTSLEAMVGRTCTVTERIEPLTGGQVSVDGGLWAARALSPEASYEVGAQPTVVAIEGVKLILR
jgi:membrane protein implicated in regulation of membrane protease activity